MESFFSLLQKNVLDRRTWATREELRIAIVTWIERTWRDPMNWSTRYENASWVGLVQVAASSVGGEIPSEEYGR